MSLKIVLADDHLIVRQGLKAILSLEADFELIGEVDNGLDVGRVVEKLLPDILVLDVQMPGLNGLEVARRLTQKFPELKIIMLTMHAEEPYVLEAVRAGALGYVRKEAGAEELVKAIRVVSTGERYFSQPFSEQALQDYLARVGSTPGTVNPTDLLTNREREVLQLTVEGHTCADIAEKLFISARTVESHRANLMKKLGVRNQKDLIRFVMQHGLISGD